MKEKIYADIRWNDIGGKDYFKCVHCGSRFSIEEIERIFECGFNKKEIAGGAPNVVGFCMDCGTRWRVADCTNMRN